MQTITSAASAIRRGEMTPVDLLEQCFERIDLLEDRIRAWVFLDREGAREQAVRLTDELKRGTDRGPLHGIPIGVKDLFDVFDWPTAAGSKRWANSLARHDCPAVARLRQAGAVIMGKTVTVAYAAFDPPATKNPWNAARTPGGSSSGSAAAVACGMCFGALGSQTGGSITRPASYCGVAGFKPTFGNISLDGVVPFAGSLDHGGALAGSVRDLALLVQPMAGSGRDAPAPRDYCAKIGTSLRKVLGLPGWFFANRMEPAMAAAFTRLVDRLRSKGWQIEECPLPPAFADLPRNHRLLMSVESLAYHGERWRRFPDDYPTKITELFREASASTGTDLVAAYAHQRALKAEIDEKFPPQIDAYLAPATQDPSPDPSTTGPNTFQAPWSYMGLPTISLPFAWTDDGLPLCLQVAGRRWQENDLVAVAAALEEDVSFEKRDIPM